MTEPAGLAIDPSGLYLAVSVKNNSFEPESNVRHWWALKGDRGLLEGTRTRIIFYELGTGNMAAEISSLFDVGCFSFSPNGRYFVAGSQAGSVCIWALAEDIASNI